MRKLQTQWQSIAYQTGTNRFFFFAALVLLPLLINGCASPSKLHSWADPNKPHIKPNKILVIGIVHDSLNGIREKVENYFVQTLKNIGYKAEASLEAFGDMASARYDQEGTYINLCNQGVDAVLTIALLNEKKAGRSYESQAKKYSSSYYYNRLLSYKTLRAKPEDHHDPPPDQLTFLWEATLFNLSTLTPLYWSQSQPFAPALAKQNHETYCRIIFNDLQKQKILNRR